MPPWVAVMTQVPAARVRAASPDTLHTPRVAEWKDTGRPEDALAVSGTMTPEAAPPGWVNEMVWGSFTRNDRVICVAAA